MALFYHYFNNFRKLSKFINGPRGIYPRFACKHEHKKIYLVNYLVNFSVLFVKLDMEVDKYFLSHDGRVSVLGGVWGHRP